MSRLSDDDDARSSRPRFVDIKESRRSRTSRLIMARLHASINNEHRHARSSMQCLSVLVRVGASWACLREILNHEGRPKITWLGNTPHTPRQAQVQAGVHF